VKRRNKGFAATLKRINRTLDEHLANLNTTAQSMLAAMPKPESKLVKTLRLIVLFAGALGTLHIVEIVRRWIIGG
jgi:hypothetical protein